MPGDLGLGPIASTEGRAGWFERESGLGWDGFDGLRSGFRSAALAPGRRRTAWWSRRAAQEYRGFLESVWRLGDEPCDAIDLSDAPVACSGRDGAPGTLALLLPERVVESGLLDRAEPLDAGSRAALHGRRSRLQAEDAPVRVPMGSGGIVSAPLSFFDDAPVRDTADRWWPTARTVAEILGDFRETRLYRTGDLLPAARVHALAASGRIEMRGGNPRRGMADTEIRSPASAASAAAP